MLEGTTDVQLVAAALGPLKMGDGGPGLLFAVWGATREARSIEAAAGEVVIRRGETGHEFLLVEDGEVEIPALACRLGAGEGFGEIALLRNMPRTATVRAATAVRLWVFTRRAFIGAVSADPDAARLVEAIVGERLAEADAVPAERHRV